jgi:hypothetical protein
VIVFVTCDTCKLEETIFSAFKYDEWKHNFNSNTSKYNLWTLTNKKIGIAVPCALSDAMQYAVWSDQWYRPDEVRILYVYIYLYIIIYFVAYWEKWPL